MARRAWRGAALVATVSVAGLLAGCSQSIGGTPRAERPDVTKVAGLEITTGESGAKPGVPDATLPVENGDGGEMDRLALNPLADVEEYWAQALPANFKGKAFEPVKRLV